MKDFSKKLLAICISILMIGVGNVGPAFVYAGNAADGQSVTRSITAGQYLTTVKAVDSKGSDISGASVKVTYIEEVEDDWGGYDEEVVEVKPESDGRYKMVKGTEYTIEASKTGYDTGKKIYTPSGDDQEPVVEVTLAKSSKKLDNIADAISSNIGAFKPEWNETATDAIRKALEKKGIDCSGVEFYYSDCSPKNYIEENGKINYVKTDTFNFSGIYSKNVDVHISLTEGDTSKSVEKPVRFTVGWDVDFFNGKIQEEADKITADTIKGENKSLDEVTTDLTLPTCIGENLKKCWSVISWYSSNSEILQVKLDDLYPNKPAKGIIVKKPEKDTVITLTASFKANESILNNNVDNQESFRTVSKDFQITVKGDNKPRVTESELKAILDKYYPDEFTYITGGGKVDMKHVKGDIQLPRYTKIRDDNNKPVFNNKEIAVTSDNEKAITINGYRAVADIFTDKPDGNLVIAFTRDGISVSKKIPYHVDKVTKEEIAAEKEKIDYAKAHYFDGLNDGVYKDAEHVTGSLKPFAEFRYDKNKKPQWIYKAKETVGDGVIPDDFFDDAFEAEQHGYNRFRSSDTSVLKNENLVLVKMPETPTKVTISSLLSSEKFKEIAKLHPDNEELQALVKQPVEVTVTVRDKTVAKDGLKKEIEKAKDLMDQITEGDEPGQYEKGTKEALKAAIDKAQAVMDRNDATEQDVDNAIDMLKKAETEASDRQNALVENITVIGEVQPGVFPISNTIKVTSKDAETYGYYKAPAYRNKVVALDAMVAAHKSIYGDDFVKNPKKYFDCAQSGWITKMFGVETINLGYLVNNMYPTYPDSPGTGSMANDTVLKNRDLLSLFLLQDQGVNDLYMFFNKTEVTVTEGETVKLDLKYMPFMETYQNSPKPAGKVPIILRDGKGELNYGETDENGVYEIKAPVEGEYVLTAVTSPQAEHIISPYCKLIVKPGSYTVDVKGEGLTLEDGKTSYKNGEKATVTVLEPEGKELTELLVNGKDKKADANFDGISYKYTFPVTENTEVEAVYKDADVKNVLTITPDKEEYTLGDDITLTYTYRGKTFEPKKDQISFETGKYVSIENNKAIVKKAGEYEISGKIADYPEISAKFKLTIRPMKVIVRMEDSDSTVLLPTEIDIDELYFTKGVNYYADVNFNYPVPVLAIEKALKGLGINTAEKAQFDCSNNGNWMINLGPSLWKNLNRDGTYMYLVNNKMAMLGAGQYALKSGDVITVYYDNNWHTGPADILTFNEQKYEGYTLEPVEFTILQGGVPGTPMKDARLEVNNDMALVSSDTSDAEGKVSYTFDKAGEYYVSVISDKKIVRPEAKVIIRENPVIQETKDAIRADDGFRYNAEGRKTLEALRDTYCSKVDKAESVSEIKALEKEYFQERDGIVNELVYMWLKCVPSRVESLMRPYRLNLHKCDIADVSFKYVESNPDVPDLVFDVRDRRDGEEVTVYHINSDNQVEIYHSAVKDGKIIIKGVKSLSPFVIAYADSAETVAPEISENTNRPGTDEAVAPEISENPNRPGTDEAVAPEISENTNRPGTDEAVVTPEQRNEGQVSNQVNHVKADAVSSPGTGDTAGSLKVYIILTAIAVVSALLIRFRKKHQ